MAQSQARPPTTSSADGRGRVAQRRRTRQAILAATKALIADGRTPSIDDVAAAADVSRRTIYMYFPTLDQLLIDATSALMTDGSVEASLDPATLGEDPLERVDTFARTLLELAPDGLPLARRMFALTVDTEPPPTAERRGYRRMEWITAVLQPLRERLDDATYQRLRSALTVVLGWEAMIVLRDTLGLGEEAEADVLRWAAAALVKAALAEELPT